METGEKNVYLDEVGTRTITCLMQDFQNLNTHVANALTYGNGRPCISYGMQERAQQKSWGEQKFQLLSSTEL
jgi:hypothetical protein